MGVHLERAWVLYRQSRYDLAAQEIAQELVEDPQSAEGYGLLGICLAEQRQCSKAIHAAEQSVRLAPDDAFSHYALSLALSKKGRLRAGIRAIEEAIRLDPHDVDFFVQLGLLYLFKLQWRKASHAAEQGLAIEPTNDDCFNIRAISKVLLGEHDAAQDVSLAALSRDPENAMSHAALGFALLRERSTSKAAEHFRAALRIDPELEFARFGLLESLKAKNVVYRALLPFIFWTVRFPLPITVALSAAIGITLLSLESLAASVPAASRIMTVVTGTYVAVVGLVMLSDAILNMLLRWNRRSRSTLSDDLVIAANVTTGLFAASIVTLGCAVWLRDDYVLSAAALLALYAVPVLWTFRCSSGRQRRLMAICTIVCIFLTMVPFLGMLWNAVLPGLTLPHWLDVFSLVLFAAGVVGIIGSPVIADFLPES